MRITIDMGDGLRTEARTRTHTLVLDEPEDVGGTDEGFRPTETLLAALGGCTAMTLRMYAGRKGWPLEAVHIELSLEPGRPGTPPRIVQHLRLEGALDEAQRARLLEIAGRCPVHKLLDGPLEIEETFA